VIIPRNKIVVPVASTNYCNLDIPVVPLRDSQGLKITSKQKYPFEISDDALVSYSIIQRREIGASAWLKDAFGNGLLQAEIKVCCNEDCLIRSPTNITVYSQNGILKFM
jgi:hypothetical protein